MEANAPPVVAWPEADWDAAVPRGMLERAWRAIMARMVAKPTRGQVRGPTAATLMSCQRIGRSWPAYNFFSRKGLFLTFDGARPAEVKSMLVRGGERALWLG